MQPTGRTPQSGEGNLFEPEHHSLIALLLPHLMTQDFGVVTNVTSGLAFRPMPRAPIYCVTKAGLHTYSMMLRQQLTETTVKVFGIIPPMVDTELNMEGRAGLMSRGILVEAYIGTVMDGLARDVYELHYDGAGNKYGHTPKTPFSLPNDITEQRLISVREGRWQYV